MTDLTAREETSGPRVTVWSFAALRGSALLRGWAFTLTTVGYGDITPVAPIARSLATFEAFVGQLYPAIILARLVSLQLAPSSGES